MQLKMKRLGIGLLIMGMLLSACGQAAPTPDEEVIVPTPTRISPAGADESPISVLPTPAPLSPAAQDAAEMLKDEVAEEVGVAPEELEVISAEEVQWSDTSLGCPEPGVMYAQVIVPGWKIIFLDAAGESYEVHTDKEQERFVMCDQDQDQKKEPPATPQPLTPGDSSPAVQAAVRTLGDMLGVSRRQIDVIKVEFVQWPDSCLGCAGPGENCLMVITPGYRVVLESGGEQYEIHTDESGARAIICGGGETAPRFDNS